MYEIRRIRTGNKLHWELWRTVKRMGTFGLTRYSQEKLGEYSSEGAAETALRDSIVEPVVELVDHYDAKGHREW